MTSCLPIVLWNAAVTWVTVPKRGLGLADVILVSLQIAAIAAAVALVLGTVLGVAIILLRRHQPPIQERVHLLNTRF
jgi:ABC-type nitrate/sulfonate/bicarbonate transport system permease component